MASVYWVLGGRKVDTDVLLNSVGREAALEEALIIAGEWETNARQTRRDNTSRATIQDTGFQDIIRSHVKLGPVRFKTEEEALKYASECEISLGHGPTDAYPVLTNEDSLGKGDWVLGLGNTGLTRDGEWVAL